MYLATLRDPNSRIWTSSKPSKDVSTVCVGETLCSAVFCAYDEMFLLVRASRSRVESVNVGITRALRQLNSTNSVFDLLCLAYGKIWESPNN
jgi:hypothetical protein